MWLTGMFAEWLVLVNNLLVSYTAPDPLVIVHTARFISLNSLKSGRNKSILVFGLGYTCIETYVRGSLPSSVAPKSIRSTSHRTRIPNEVWHQDC